MIVGPILKIHLPSEATTVIKSELRSILIRRAAPGQPETIKTITFKDGNPEFVKILKKDRINKNAGTGVD
jgi:hypothetical protein